MKRRTVTPRGGEDGKFHDGCGQLAGETPRCRRHAIRHGAGDPAVDPGLVPLPERHDGQRPFGGEVVRECQRHAQE